MIKYGLATLASVLLIIFDQFTKYIAEMNLQPVSPIELIPGVFSLYYLTNEGAAFGAFQGGRWFFVILTVVMMFVMIIFYIKLPKAKHIIWYRVSIIVIFAGAMGNFMDRLIQGYVIDFFYFSLINFPVFNVADIYVVTGTILLVFLMFFVPYETDTKINQNENDLTEDVI